MSANTVAGLKITLDAVKPAVLRHIEVPFDIRLDRLHLTMQAALGWTNSHLYEIRAGDVGWSTLYPEADWPEDFLDARKARLDKVIEDVGTKTLHYIYDFGRWLGAHDQDRAAHRSRARRTLSAPDRSDRPLPSRRLWRRLGLCRIPRCDPRSRS